VTPRAPPSSVAAPPKTKIRLRIEADHLVDERHGVTLLARHALERGPTK
jgi:hypothetical protein